MEEIRDRLNKIHAEVCNSTIVKEKRVTDETILELKSLLESALPQRNQYELAIYDAYRFLFDANGKRSHATVGRLLSGALAPLILWAPPAVLTYHLGLSGLIRLEMNMSTVDIKKCNVISKINMIE
jgi:hypothetical protein